MAISKKGSRRITVDGLSFRWRVRHRPTYSQGLGWANCVLALEATERSGAKLIVVLPQLHTGNWMKFPARAVLPS